MNNEIIETFLAMATYGSFTKAAHHLLVSQSAVSKRIKELEEELEATLFVRDKKSVTLTAAGERFYPYAVQFLQLQECALDAVRHFDKSQEKLTVGCVESLYDCHLIQLLQFFCKEHPNIHVHLQIDHSQNILSKLYDGSIDIAFTFQKFSDHNYSCIPFRQDRIILVTGRGNAAYPHGLRDEEIIQLPLIHENLAYMADKERFEAIYSRNVNGILSIGTNSRIVPHLASGVGYGFVVESYVQEQLKQGVLQSIPLLSGEPLPLCSYMIYRNSGSMCKHTFTDFVKSEI